VYSPVEDLYRKLQSGSSPEETAISDELEVLNEYQKAAVTDHSRMLLVNAQVGSGKTTVLIGKILYLHFIKHVPLQSMVVLTFTNKAANEIKSRLKEKNRDIKEEELLFFGTFHSVCRTMLANVLPVDELGYTRDFSIVDTDEMLEVYERVINDNELTVKYKNKLKKRLEQYRQGKLLYGSMKYIDDMSDFYRLLQEEKKRCNIMEFDDLIDNATALLKKHPINPEWIIIDEFQDCDSRQLELIENIKGEKTHIFAVGDPNQVIYTWRGSRMELFSEFRHRYGAKELTLPINYRSTATILDAARAFLEPGQSISGVRKGGMPIIVKKHYNTFNEALYLCDRIRKLMADGLNYSDIAILYRKQKQSEVFEQVFQKEGIPYEVSVKKTLKDIPVLYWVARLLKASTNTGDRDSLYYVLGDRRYGLGMNRKQIKSIVDTAGKGESMELPLLGKIKGFMDWCAGLEKEVQEAELFDYFDLNSYLSPTSITYNEDRNMVMSLLQGICEYVRHTGKKPYWGIKEYLNNSALYGSQILEETAGRNEDSVKLMTLHASKGLEFRQVFISGANLGLIPLHTGCRDNEEEERRLFFVGITRAKDFLEISYHTNPEEYGVYGVPSPFLRLIPQELIESEDLGSRAANLTSLRKTIKTNMEEKKREEEVPKVVEVQRHQADNVRRVRHYKYGEGIVVNEDESNITVNFELYGEKVFSKAFSELEYL